MRDLPKRGWTKPEIDRTVQILREAPEKRPDWLRFLDAALYWILILVSIFANFIISIVLVPFLLVLSGAILYGALFFLGIVFGTMLDVVVRETEYLQKKHYVIAEVLIPAIALINIYMITGLTNQLAVALSLPNVNNQPWLVALMYVVAFSLPHIVFKLAHMHRTTPTLTA